MALMHFRPRVAVFSPSEKCQDKLTPLLFGKRATPFPQYASGRCAKSGRDRFGVAMFCAAFSASQDI
jgi:hypothetical protein